MNARSGSWWYRREERKTLAGERRRYEYMQSLDDEKYIENFHAIR